MRVARIGWTPVKGGRHETQASATLTAAGPVGDRRFCLVEGTADRCLRTVDNPSLLPTRATWDGRDLTVELPSGTVTGAPVPTGVVRHVDYWGRDAPVEVVDGPWAAAYSAHLGREVVLARARPGDVVYAGAVSLVTRSSLAWLADIIGSPVDGARFRATFELDDQGLPPRAEEGWVRRRVRVGTAEVEIRGVVPRCAVVDLDPASGVRDLPVLKALARCAGREMTFGVHGEVVVPGEVRLGDLADAGGLQDESSGRLAPWSTATR